MAVNDNALFLKDNFLFVCGCMRCMEDVWLFFRVRRKERDPKIRSRIEGIEQLLLREIGPWVCAKCGCVTAKPLKDDHQCVEAKQSKKARVSK